MKSVEWLKEQGIDVDESLELLGDMDMFNETLEDFITELEERLPKLESYRTDLENYAILVHAMKSDAKYLGLTTLAELSYQQELESKAGNHSYIQEHYDELLQEVNRIQNIAQMYFGNA